MIFTRTCLLSRLKTFHFDSACPHTFLLITPSPPHIGVLVRRAVIPKIPQVVLKKKKDQLPQPAPGHHSRSRAPNTTDLPEAGPPGSAQYEHEGEDEDGFGNHCFLKNKATTDSLRDWKWFQLPSPTPGRGHCRRTCLGTHRLALGGNTKKVDRQAKCGTVGRSSVPGRVGSPSFSLTSGGSD